MQQWRQSPPESNDADENLTKKNGVFEIDEAPVEVSDDSQDKKLSMGENLSKKSKN